MAAFCASIVAPVAPAAPTTKSSLARLSSSSAKRTVLPAVSNRTISKTTCMQVWQPTDNKFFETLSYLPPLTDDQISKQVDYVTRNGWIPCLEFAEAEMAYVKDNYPVRFGGGVAPNYADNRYWTMWKLPLFGCTDSSQVLSEIAACTKAFPTAYIRLVAFDNKRQVQIAGFLVHRPESASDYRAPEGRSV